MPDELGAIPHRFEWDENKNRANRQKHGIAFEEAQEIFAEPVFTVLDARTDYGEEQLVSVGVIGGAVVIVVVHTERRGGTRIISARKANRRESESYYEQLAAAHPGD